MLEIVELGGHVKKGLGQILVEELADNAAVHALTIEMGRAQDLFDFKEFGTAGEVDIVSLLVDKKHAVHIFDVVCALLDITRGQGGIVFMTGTVMKNSLAQHGVEQRVEHEIEAAK